MLCRRGKGLSYSPGSANPTEVVKVRVCGQFAPPTLRSQREDLDKPDVFNADRPALAKILKQLESEMPVAGGQAQIDLSQDGRRSVRHPHSRRGSLCPERQQALKRRPERFELILVLSKEPDVPTVGGLTDEGLDRVCFRFRGIVRHDPTRVGWPDRSLHVLRCATEPIVVKRQQVPDHPLGIEKHSRKHRWTSELLIERVDQGTKPRSAIDLSPPEAIPFAEERVQKLSRCHRRPP